MKGDDITRSPRAWPVALAAAVLLLLSCNTILRAFEPPDSEKQKQIDIYLYDANFYARQGQYEQAAEQYTKVLELDPQNTSAYFERGLAYISMGDYGSAANDYTHYIEIDPDSASAYNNRCWSLYKLEKYAEALPDCEQAVQMSRDDINILDSRARVYAGLGRTQEAIADFERIAELSPDSELAQHAQEALIELKGEAPGTPAPTLTPSRTPSRIAVTPTP